MPHPAHPLPLHPGLDAAQRTPGLQGLDARVLAVLPREDGHWDVIVDDTPLYAEGGGQPADRGQLGGAPVLDVQRGPDGWARHRVAVAPEVGQRVRLKVDTARRWDHTQQHSGQHLLSALAAARLGLDTVGFHLGADLCTVDLSGLLPPERWAELEDAVNDVILEDRPVRAFEVAADAAPAALRSRDGAPARSGPLRLVEIDGVDLNPCGGTHVTRTGELQLLMLLRGEKVRGGTRLSFVVGGRARRRAQQLRDREAALTGALRCPPEGLPEAVRRLGDDLKAAHKALGQAQLRVADAEGAAMAAAAGAVVLAEQGDPALVGPVAEAAARRRPDGVFVVIGPPADGERPFFVAGAADAVAALGPRLAGALGGRGGGRGGRFQGRAPAGAGLDAARAALGLP